jgi:AAA domain
MIIMLNGAFGAGKTTVATNLLDKIDNSMLFDPELVGYMIRAMLPEDIKSKESESGDFQNYELWKVLTVDTAKRLIDKYGKHLIVPMTLRIPEYFTYIFNGFKEIDDETYHFCLQASRGTVFKRLRDRGEEEGNWCFQQTEKCLLAYEEYDFGEYIDTNDVDINNVVGKIMEKLNTANRQK